MSGSVRRRLTRTLAEEMRSEHERWGVHAFGLSESIEISLDERIDQEGWELAFNGRGVTIAFHVASSEVAKSLLRFMKENYGKTKVRRAKAGELVGVEAGAAVFSEVASIELATPGPSRVRVNKCGELPDRFCFGLLGHEHRCHVDLHDPHTSNVISALEGLATEIEDG